MSATTLTTETDLLPPPHPALADGDRVLLMGLRIVREAGRGVIVERIHSTRGVAWLPTAHVVLTPCDFFMTRWNAAVPVWVYRKIREQL